MNVRRLCNFWSVEKHLATLSTHLIPLNGFLIHTKKTTVLMEKKLFQGFLQGGTGDQKKTFFFCR